MSSVAVSERAGPEVRSRLPVRSIVHVALFALVALYFLAWPIWRAQFPVEIWPTEGWNAYFQDAAAAGRRLYPDPAGFVGNNYPPLSFYAIGLIGKLTNVDNLFVGRCVSILALLSLSVEIFLAVRLIANSAIAGIIGALWYLAIMAHNSTLYIGTNDPQLAAEAIMGAALVWFLKRDRDGGSAMTPLLLMVVAGFWKHNAAGIPITAIVWLFIRHGNGAIRPASLSALAAAAGLLACILVFGSDFLPNMLAHRQYAWANVLTNVGHLQWCAPAFAIWALWASTNFGSPAANFTAVHIGTGLIACILQWFGHGVGGNAEFDLIIGLAIGIGVTFAGIQTSRFAARIGVDRARDSMIALLLLRLIAVDRHETALLMLSPNFRAALYENERVARAEASAISKLSGDIACSNKVVCRAAGKPFVFDEFKMEELIGTGAMTRMEQDALIDARGIHAFKNSAASSADVNTSLFHWLNNKGPS